MFKNIASQKVLIYAHDVISDIAKTGASANITAYISKDGAAPAQSNDVNPTELDSTNMPGVYVFDLTQAETNCDTFLLYAKSSTDSVAIDIVNLVTVPLGLSAQAKLDVNVEADTALANYDPPTRTEASSDKDFLYNLIFNGHLSLTQTIGNLNNISSAEVAVAVLEKLIADHSGTAGSLAACVKFIKDWLEGDSETDTSDPAQYQFVKKIKSTDTELGRKNILDADGNPITSTTIAVANLEESV